MKIPSPSSPPTMLNPRPVVPLWINTLRGSLQTQRGGGELRPSGYEYLTRARIVAHLGMSSSPIMPCKTGENRLGEVGVRACG